MDKIEIVIIGIILLIQSICDIRWKKIPILVTVAGAVIGIILFFFKDISMIEAGLSFFPGICCLLFSKSSREALGYGDSLLLCVMGFFYSVEELLLILLMAIGFAGIAAILLLVVLKKHRKYEMAFVPFLFMAYGVNVWISI